MINCVSGCTICHGSGKIDIIGKHPIINGVEIRFYLCPNIEKGFCRNCSHHMKFHVLDQDNISRHRCLFINCNCLVFDNKVD